MTIGVMMAPPKGKVNNPQGKNQWSFRKTQESPDNSNPYGIQLEEQLTPDQKERLRYRDTPTPPALSLITPFTPHTSDSKINPNRQLNPIHHEIQIEGLTAEKDFLSKNIDKYEKSIGKMTAEYKKKPSPEKLKELQDHIRRFAEFQTKLNYLNREIGILNNRKIDEPPSSRKT